MTAARLPGGRALAFLSACLLAACASAPAPSVPPAAPGPTPAEQVARVRAAAGADPAELSVEPVRDPRIGDLRAQAARDEGEGRPDAAAQALDAALAIAPGDPSLLQERAEVALLMRDPGKAEALARRAWSLGSQVGPLCRRHWATVREARGQAGDPAGVAEASARVEACTRARPPRF